MGAKDDMVKLQESRNKLGASKVYNDGLETMHNLPPGAARESARQQIITELAPFGEQGQAAISRLNNAAPRLVIGSDAFANGAQLLNMMRFGDLQLTEGAIDRMAQAGDIDPQSAKTAKEEIREGTGCTAC